MNTVTQISPAEGTLGVLIVGINGAVATTLMAGIMAVRKERALPVGSLTQMGTMERGYNGSATRVPLKEALPLASLDDLVFGGWDVREGTALDAAEDARVIDAKDLSAVRDELAAITPMKGVFDQRYVKNLTATWEKDASTKAEAAEMLREDIRRFRQETGARRLVVLWCASTEAFVSECDVHQSLDEFTAAMRENHPSVSPSMVYAYAALMEGVPFINGAPNLTTDCPALMQLAAERSLPIAGKDFKTGQTLMKTVIAPMLKARMLGLSGWYSTNLLGNRDGEVLDDPESFRTKEESKLSVLDGILDSELYPSLYGKYMHKVRINYYPPRGDNKEGWDNIDIFGWMGYPMQIKVDFLCRDSILAAPVALDLVLFTDLARRSGMSGVQDWLSFYFKSPMHERNVRQVFDLFEEQANLYAVLQMLADVYSAKKLETV
ncbi:MAG: inositol-3-phosphate synthase [Acidobacteriota bacterium]